MKPKKNPDGLIDAGVSFIYGMFEEEGRGSFFKLAHLSRFCAGNRCMRRHGHCVENRQLRQHYSNNCHEAKPQMKHNVTGQKTFLLFLEGQP